MIPFPDDFVWGASTSAYQIEGAVAADGRGPSIWDVFSHTPGKVIGGDTGDVACDHYNRYGEDVDLLAAAGFRAYRFSIAWPRVFPDGTGRVNAAGLDFYDRLVDALLARGVEPWACLYHWDLPQALQARGGWLGRDVVPAYAEYAEVAVKRLGDRVKRWITFNEPNVHALFGYGLGEMAPGLRGRGNVLAAIHHQNLAHGTAVAALRAARGDLRIGTVLSLQPSLAATDRPEDRRAAEMWDAVWNTSCLDPLFRGAYPDLLASEYAPLVRPGDLETIPRPIDFLGVNYYSPMYQRADAGGLFGTGWGATPPGIGLTAMKWPIQPHGLYDQLIRLRDGYGNPEVYVTESGAAFDDRVDSAGQVEDAARIAFLRDHLHWASRAVADGARLKGYFVWSLLDNFEWANGYSKRFGIVRVDYATQRRTPKASYHWLARQMGA
ncbi:MAG: GH1 family beta-glucosidase [Gemmatimonas sp.]